MNSAVFSGRGPNFYTVRQSISRYIDFRRIVADISSASSYWKQKMPYPTRLTQNYNLLQRCDVKQFI